MTIVRGIQYCKINVVYTKFDAIIQSALRKL